MCSWLPSLDYIISSASPYRDRVNSTIPFIDRHRGGEKDSYASGLRNQETAENT